MRQKNKTVGAHSVNQFCFRKQLFTKQKFVTPYSASRAVLILICSSFSLEIVYKTNQARLTTCQLRQRSMKNTPI